MKHLLEPLRGLEAWTAFLSKADVPVSREMVAAIGRLREREEDISPSEIADVVQSDPLMTLKVLAFASQRRSSRVVTDSETVTSSLVLMGVSPFFRQFDNLVAYDDLLAENPAALAGLETVVERAYCAARFALAFAIHRGDPDAGILQECAMLHDFAEMLIWCCAPELSLEVLRRQAEDPTLRSSAAQRAVLNVQFNELQRALMHEWKLPEMVSIFSDHRLSTSPRVRNVVLAVNMARHVQRGWDNAALPDDYADVASLLGLRASRVESMVRELAHDE